MKRFFLNDVFKVGKLLHSTLVGTKALLKEATSLTTAFKFDKIHSTAFVWRKSGNLVDDFANKSTASTSLLLTFSSRHLLKGETKPVTFFEIVIQLDHRFFTTLSHFAYATSNDEFLQ